MSDLHGRDIIEWSEHQSYRLAAGKPTNEAFNWANITEQIESVGSKQRHMIASLLMSVGPPKIKVEALSESATPRTGGRRNGCFAPRSEGGSCRRFGKRSIWQGFMPTRCAPCLRLGWIAVSGGVEGVRRDAGWVAERGRVGSRFRTGLAKVGIKAYDFLPAMDRLGKGTRTLSMIPILAREARAYLQDRPRLKALAKGIDESTSRMLHSVAAVVPAVITPRPRQITIAITAHCNLRCQGCRYGRDFMPGSQLSLDIVKQVLDDAREGGVGTVRFYGGEPLLHTDLPAMIRHACNIGLRPYVTSNATHLGNRVNALHEAGLRLVTIGFYGIGKKYDDYTQRNGHFARLERSLEQVRRLHGKTIELQLNFVLLRDTCNLDDLHRAWDFARRFDMYFHLDLANYSAPFFVTGIENALQLREEDRPRAEEVSREMIALKRAEPDRFLHSLEFLRSIPDWLLKGPDMRIKCDAYELLWVGADGTLQLCDVALPLGNVNETRLRDILFTKRHRDASRAGFRLDCPNCTCKAETRLRKDAAAMRRYAHPMPGEDA